MTTTISEQTSCHLRLLSGLSVYFVVCIHATTFKYDTAFESGAFTGQFQSFLSHHLFHVALPLFFINAAFFLFYGVESVADIRPRLRRRILTLLMPYLAWSGLWVVVGLFFGLLPDPTIKGIMSTWVFHPLAGQFWFLRDLIALVILAPLILWLSRPVLLSLSIFAWLWWLWYQTLVGLDLRIHWYELISNEALCWFLFGAVAARYSNIVLNRINKGFSAPLLIIFFVVWIIGSKVPNANQITHGLSVTAGTLLLLGASPYMRKAAASRCATVFAGYGFLIYAGHHPAIGMVQTWLLHGSSGNQIYHLAAYLLTPLAIIATLICVFSMLSRFTPLIVYIANGGRHLPALRAITRRVPL